MATELRIQDDIGLQLQLRGLGALIKQVTGTTPGIVDKGDHYLIVLNDAQLAQVQNWIHARLTGKPGKVRFETGKILAPPLAKAYGKIAILSLAIAFALGRAIK